MEVVRKHEDFRDGNDCIIYDSIIMMEFHGRYLIEVLRKVNGCWTPDGIDVIQIREFSSKESADDFFDLLKNDYILR